MNVFQRLNIRVTFFLENPGLDNLSTSCLKIMARIRNSIRSLYNTGGLHLARAHPGSCRILEVKERERDKPLKRTRIVHLPQKFLNAATKFFWGLPRFQTTPLNIAPLSPHPFRPQTIFTTFSCQLSATNIWKLIFCSFPVFCVCFH